MNLWGRAHPVTNDYIFARLGITKFALRGWTIEEVEGEAAREERLIYSQVRGQDRLPRVIIDWHALVAAMLLSHVEVEGQRQETGKDRRTGLSNPGGISKRACVEAWWMGCKEPRCLENGDGQGSVACRV